MTPSSEVPEYILEEKSEKISRQLVLSRISNQQLLVHIVAKLKQQSLLHNTQADTLDEIRDLVLELQRLQEDT